MTPLWLTIAPDGKTVYVANTADDTVSAFDVATKEGASAYPARAREGPEADARRTGPHLAWRGPPPGSGQGSHGGPLRSRLRGEEDRPVKREPPGHQVRRKGLGSRVVVVDVRVVDAAGGRDLVFSLLELFLCSRTAEIATLTIWKRAFTS